MAILFETPIIRFILKGRTNQEAIKYTDRDKLRKVMVRETQWYAQTEGIVPSLFWQYIIRSVYDSSRMISIDNVSKSNLSKERGRARTLLQRSHRIMEFGYLRGPPNPQPPALRWAFRSSVCVFPCWWKTSKDLQQIYKRPSRNFLRNFFTRRLLRAYYSWLIFSIL